MVFIKIFEKINSIIANENVENIKYDPLPLGNSCCLDNISSDYNYFNFLYEKDSSGELKNFIKESIRIEKICKRKDFKLFYLQPSTIRPKLKSFAQDIFPKKGDVSKTILSNITENFVSQGDNIGKKRIFKKYFIRKNANPVEIDILTNDNKKDISKDKTEEDFFTLVSDIQKNNSVEDPKTLNLTKDMKMFKIESIISSLRESIWNIFIENDFLKKLVNDYVPVLVEGTLTEIKQLWDRLDVALDKVTDNVISIFPNKKTKDRIKEILENIDNFSKTDKVDKEIMDHEDRIILEKGKRKENAYKNYLNNYLKKYVSMLSTGKLQNMDSEYSFDDFTFSDFTKKKHRNVFKKMKDITKILSKFNCIYGLEVVKDCEGSKLDDSKFSQKFNQIIEINFHVNS